MGYVGKMITCVVIMISLAVGMYVVNSKSFESTSFVASNEDLLVNESKASPALRQASEKPPANPFTTPVNFNKNEEAVTVAAMGSVFISPKQIDEAKTQNGYDFMPTFRYIKPYIEKADIAMVNLNSPVAGGELSVSSGSEYISNAPIEILDALNTTGFDVITTANSHTLDKGRQGVESTIKNIRSKDLKESGTYLLNEEKQIVMEEIKGMSVAICSYTEAVGKEKAASEADMGYNIVDLRNAVNFINKEKIIADIKILKNKGADIIILNLCFNENGDDIPSQKHLELSKTFIKEGADIIFGAGLNSLNGVDVYSSDNNDGVIVHSLGNAVSDAYAGTESMMVFMDIVKIDGNNKIENIRYIPTYNYTGNNKYEILPCNKGSLMFFDENQQIAANSTYSKTVNNIGEGVAIPVE